MRIKTIFPSLILLLLLTLPMQSLFAQELKILEFDNLERSYIVNLPDSYDEESPAPLVIVLHGAGGNSFDLQLGTDIDETANELGFIAVFPDGYQQGWSFLDEDEMAQDEDWTDDVGFIDALIDQVIEDYNVDIRRIFVAGISNGALLALRLGCELDDRLAGVAAVAATYSFELAQHCVGTAPLPTVIVWGTEDIVFPLEGFVWVTPDGKIRSSFSLNQTRSYFATRYQCETVSPALQAESEDSPFDVHRQIYTGCNSGVPAIFYLIIGEEHGWPRAEIIQLDGETVAPIEMAFFEVFANIQRPEVAETDSD